MREPSNIHETNGGSVTVGLPTKDDEVVYFMYSAGLIKIGWTADLMRRWDELQIRSAAHIELLAAFPGGVETELELHRTFKADRLRGEWFRPSSHMRDFFKRIDATGIPPQGSITDRLAALESCP